MKLQQIKKQASLEWAAFSQKGKSRIRIGSGTCGRAAGAMEVFGAFANEISKRKLNDLCQIIEVGCLGLCYAEPLVEVEDPYGAQILYQKVRSSTVPKIVESHWVKGQPLTSRALAVTNGQAFNGIPLLSDLPMIQPQFRIALHNCGIIDPSNIHHYIARGGYASLASAFAMTPAQVIDIVEASNLRGRGGAGFPTGLKWRLCRDAPGDVRYVVCNGDEGDPGAFMDRSLMEGDPHAVIEGMLIGAYAIGAREGVLYVRGEYPLAIERLKTAVKQAKNAGFLGPGIMDTGFDFELRLVCNAGAFISGEETALINSVEGSVAEPRPRPPFPAQKGLFAQPTCINNVETWANIPLIIKNGADWFKEIGAENNGGTKLFSLSGKVRHTGLVEIPMGTTLRKVVYDAGGGIPGKKTFKAVQTGGPAGGCIPESMLDLPLTYEGLAAAGAIMGSGGMIVLDSDTCMVDVALYFLNFSTEESCGQCTSCREGTVHMRETLNRICSGNGRPEDLDVLEKLARSIGHTSLCGLGQNAPNPVLTTMNYFRHEYESHIRDKKCPAGVCKALITYRIDPETCDGCTACLKICPMEAVTGSKKEVHAIDADKCIKCGTCREVCKHDAVIVE